MGAARLQLKCWLMPGEEEEKRKEIEGQKTSAAPPIFSTASSSTSLASAATDAAAPPPTTAGGSLLKRGVAGRYASTGGFGPAGATTSSTGDSGSGMMGGLRPPVAFGAGAAATLAPAMFKPPSAAFIPAAPGADDQVCGV